MEFAKLNNGVKMHMVGLGTWDLRGEECVSSVKKAIGLGYRLIDTAILYENECEVAEGVRQSGIDRHELFITTKINRPQDSYEKTEAAILCSLKKLNTDYIDLLLLHEPFPARSDMYRAMEVAYKKGLVRAIGISNFGSRLFNDFIKECEIMPALNQVECHVHHQKANLSRLMRENGVVMQAWSPFARNRESVVDHPLLQKIGEAHNKTAAQVALRFLIQNGISVVPKSRSVDRLKENIDIFDFSLSLDEMKKIKALDKAKTLFPWTEKYD